MPDIDRQQLAQLEASVSKNSDARITRCRSVSASHIGNVRPLNEDAFLELTEQKLWAVADGMGGLSRGDYASRAVVKALEDFSASTSVTENIAALEKRLLDTNETCRTAFRGKKLGTTVALLFLQAMSAYVVWAGDSRIYRLRNHTLNQLTEDHSLLNDQIRRQQIDETSASTALSGRAAAHVLTRAVGVHKTLKLELNYLDLQHGDRFLICTDGLYNALSEQDMRPILGQGSIEDALECLMKTALEHGGEDNITAILVEVELSSEAVN